MLYIILILVLLFLVYHIVILPEFFQTDSNPNIKRIKKIKLIAVVSIAGIVLFFSNFVDTWSYDSGHIWTILALTWILITSLYSAVEMYNRNSNFKLDYEKLRSVKHGEKDELIKLQKEIDEKTSNLEKNILDNENHSDKLKRTESILSVLEKELNNKKLQLDSSISKEINKKKQELENEYHQKIIDQKNTLQESYNRKLNEYTERLTKKMEDRINYEKSNIVDNIYQFDGIDDDDFFEIKKEKEEIKKSKIMMEMDQKIITAQEHVLDAKKSALEVKSENVDIRSEIKNVNNQFKIELLKEQTDRKLTNEKLLYKLEAEQKNRELENLDIKHHLQLMEERNNSKFQELKHYFENQLMEVKMETREAFRIVKESLVDMKLQFSQEIMRLDGQQQNILVELEKYYLKSKEFVHECQTIAFEAKRQNLEGGKILNEVNTLYKQHKAETTQIESRMNHSLNTISVKEGQFANAVAENYLRIQHANQENHLALRDIALERKGVDFAYKAKESEQQMMLQEIRHRKKDLARASKIDDLNYQLDRQEYQSMVEDEKNKIGRMYDKFYYEKSIDRAEKNHRYLQKLY